MMEARKEKRRAKHEKPEPEKDATEQV
jgi:hypothetical protein